MTIRYRNTHLGYGMVTILVHWVSALVIIGQFALGLFMLTLDYYDPNYLLLPHYHKSIGILFGLVLLFRLVWMLINPRPGPAPGVTGVEHRLATVVQWALLLGLVAVVVCGYLISTARGEPIAVFDWFHIPATITTIPKQEDIAGALHYWFAVGVIIGAAIHALAALRHHFIKRDTTLRRMLGKG